MCVGSTPTRSAKIASTVFTVARLVPNQEARVQLPLLAPSPSS